MCGICGWAYRDRARPVPERQLRRAAARLAHRGPDDEGVFRAPGVGLAARRLAVIDRPGGHQPMTTPDGRYTIVYNGEVYNHAALRKELSSRGHAFRSRCDTEVVLHGWAAWGAGLLDRVNGMFAFAVWDAQTRTLFLARDRFGVKPLYLAEGPQGLAFASEIKALFADPEVPREPDLGAVGEYLHFGYVPGPRTGFQGISKLAAGHVAQYRDGALTVREYWDVPLHEAEDEAPDLGEALDKAVAARLMSDVPLGVFLSGGVDSTLVTSAAAGARPGVDTFTIRFGARAYDEGAHAQRVADQLGARHHAREVDGQALAHLEHLVWHLEEPLADSSALALFPLCAFAREHVTVALAGDGGDELGAGYPRYLWDARAERLGRLPGLRAAGALAGRAMAAVPALRETGRRVRKFARTAALARPERYAAWFACFDEAARRNLLAPEALGAADARAPAEILRGPLARAQARGAPPLTRLQYADLKTYLVDDLLLKADKASMAASLELRAPLLDPGMAHALLAVPAKRRMRSGRLKAPLRGLAAARVPAASAGRPKQGFQVPLAAWLASAANGVVDKLLCPEAVRKRGLLRPEAVAGLLARAREARTDVAGRVYALLVLEAWHRVFFD